MTVAASRWPLITAGLLGTSGVAAGAFGAHALKSWVTAPMLDVWKTAAHYQLIHALALLALGLACVCFPPLRLRRTLVWVQGCWLAGSLLFSGSLYLLVLTGSTSLGVITPVGGVFLITGWLLLTVAALNLPTSH